MIAYETGTVAVTNGSTEIVGSGTAWLSALCSQGDKFELGGVEYELSKVTGEDLASLTIPYRGASASGQSYAINRDFSETTLVKAIEMILNLSISGGTGGGLTEGRTINATGSLVDTDVSTFMESNVAAAHNIAIPNDSTLATSGVEEMQVYVSGAGLPTFVAGSGVTLNGLQGFTALCTNSIVKLRRVAANTWDVELGGYETNLGKEFTGTAHTLDITDFDTDTAHTSSNAATQTFTIPLFADVPFRLGAVFWIEQIGVGKVTIAITSGGTLHSGGDLFSTAETYNAICAVNIGTVDSPDQWRVYGKRVA